MKPALPNVTGIRIPEDLRARLDALVDVRNTELAPEGLSTNRNAMVVKLLRDALDAVDAKRAATNAPGGAGASTGAAS